MANKPISPGCDQCCCVFKISFRVAFTLNQSKTMNSQKECPGQAQLGNNLEERKRALKPIFCVQEY